MSSEPVGSNAAMVFHKMHGAGNDFVLLDWRDSDRQLQAHQATLIADRRRGIGCDQILILRNSSRPDCLAAYEIRNADGSPAGQCGNGARCIALYLQMQGVDSRQFTLDSPAGPISVTRCDDGEFELDMGQPRFAAGQVPIMTGADLKVIGNTYQLESPFGPLKFGAASMGNPHALLEVGDIELAEVEAIGRFMGRHRIFPEGCNIGFTQVLDRGSIRLRVFERGAGETLACGSGACAAVAILRQANRVDEQVKVFLPGGLLVIKWPAAGKGVRMKGPAIHVFSATLPHIDN
jgi:diaminopimelate epimerase